MLSKRFPKYENAVFLAVFLCLGFFFQFNRFDQLPTAIHPWAQSDRYALAKGFLNNNFNLLKPETFLMNREFPHNFKKAENNSITAVNLPLHEYVIAIIMKLLNSESIWIFRLYNFLFSYLGLFALFKSCRLLKLSFLSSILVVSLLFFSPVFLIYQVTTLGIINTLSLVFVSLYWYLKFQQSNNWKHFYISLSILTVASIIRSTAFVPFVAILITELIKSIYLKKFYWQVIPILILSLGALGLHYYYMSLHMVYHYGSVFLYYIVPATSYQEAFMILKRSRELWFFHYFSASQWFLLISIILLGLFLLFRKKRQLTKSFTLLGIFSVFCLGGYLLFSVAMLTKFKDHDYYVLDSVLIPILLMAFFFMKQIDAFVKQKRVFSNLAILTLVSIMAVNANKTVAKAIEPKSWQNTVELIDAYQEARNNLDELKVAKNAKVLVVGAEYSPNLPLLLLDKKGYVLRWQDSTEMEHVLDWDYDYLLFSKLHYFDNYHELNKGFLNHFEILSKKGEVVIAQKSKERQSYQIEDFISQENFTLHFSDSIGQNTDKDFWLHYKFLENGNGFIEAIDEFGLTYERTIEFQKTSNLQIDFKFSYKGLKPNSISEIVVFYQNKLNPQNKYYKIYKLNQFELEEEGWRTAKLLVNLKAFEGDGLFKVYIWNRSQDSIEYKNVKLNLFKR